MKHIQHYSLFCKREVCRKSLGIWVLFFSLLSANPDVLFSQSKNSAEGDRQALLDLYKATGGDEWTYKNGWLEGIPSNAWHGVRVDRSGRVVRLDLSDNNLKGVLPASIGNLTQVRYFNVKQNNLTGMIPSSIGNMGALQYLLLNGRIEDPTTEKDHHPGKESGTGTEDRSNNFTGAIPHSIGNLSNLLFFECTGKNVDVEGLSGPIPSSVGNLSRLIGLHLDYNDLTDIPKELGNLGNLRHLGLGVNKLNGGIPQTVSQLVSLRYFRIGNNGIGGTIPDICSLQDLRLFSSTFNDLEGPIPPCLTDGTIPNISTISLAHNNLTGEIPEFGTSTITMFTVDNNNLTGSIPPSITNARRLINFGVGWNDLSGDFPPDLSMMYQLRYIRAQNNNFSGTLPRLDVSNHRLQNLSFQNNRMSGKIPVELAQLARHSSFSTINIRNNHFTEGDIEALKKALSEIDSLEVLSHSVQAHDTESLNSVASGSDKESRDPMK